MNYNTDFSKSVSIQKPQNTFCINATNVPSNTHSHDTIRIIFFSLGVRDRFIILTVSYRSSFCVCPQCDSAASLMGEIGSSTKTQVITGKQGAVLFSFPLAFSGLTIKYSMTLIK